MCTAVSLLSGDFYFGRNLDYEFSYGESVTVTPRHYPFSFINSCYSMKLSTRNIKFSHIEKRSYKIYSTRVSNKNYFVGELFRTYMKVKCTPILIDN